MLRKNFTDKDTNTINASTAKAYIKLIYDKNFQTKLNQFIRSVNNGQNLLSVRIASILHASPKQKKASKEDKSDFLVEFYMLYREAIALGSRLTGVRLPTYRNDQFAEYIEKLKRIHKKGTMQAADADTDALIEARTPCS